MAKNWKLACAYSKLRDGQPIGLTIEGRQIGIYKYNGAVHALEDVCTHAYALMSQGFQEDGTIECPLHAGKFDICTGRALCPPVDRDLRLYDVKIEGDDILVDLSDP